MTTDQFESDLRSALARCAAEISPAVGARIRDHRYYRRPLSAPVVGLTAAVVAVGTGAAVVVMRDGPAPAPAHGVASGGKPGLPAQLTTVTLTLPAELRTVDRVCGTAGSETSPSITSFGHTVAPPPGPGCLQVQVSHGPLPVGVTHVRVGDDVVGLTTDPAAGQATLYVDAADPGSPAGATDDDVVKVAVTAAGLSVSAVAPGAVTAPPTPLAPCSGDCG